MKEGTFLPRDAPLILLAPDSEGSTTFFYFYSEKARLDSNMFFFSYYLLCFVVAWNFFMTSPKRSDASSGGFSFYTFTFSSLPFFPFYLGFCSSLTELSSLLVSTFIDELWLDSSLILELWLELELLTLILEVLLTFDELFWKLSWLDLLLNELLSELFFSFVCVWAFVYMLLFSGFFIKLLSLSVFFAF